MKGGDPYGSQEADEPTPEREKFQERPSNQRPKLRNGDARRLPYLVGHRNMRVTVIHKLGRNPRPGFF